MLIAALDASSSEFGMFKCRSYGRLGTRADTSV